MANSEWWRTAKHCDEADFKITNSGRTVAIRFRNGEKINSIVEVHESLLTHMAADLPNLAIAAREERLKAGIESAVPPNAADIPQVMILTGAALAANPEGPILLLEIGQAGQRAGLALRISQEGITQLKGQLDNLLTMRLQYDAD